MDTISVNKDRCILCGACVDTCPAHIFFDDEKEIKTRHPDYCIGCGHCAAVCPEDAVVHSGLDLSSFIPAPNGPGVTPDLLTAFLRSRRSCRAYLDKEVPKELLERLIDMARYAPTGHNAQNVAFVVVSDRPTIKKLSGLAAEFYGNLALMIEKSPDQFTPFVRDMLPGFQRNYEFYKAGKDRIFRGAPVVCLLYASADNRSSGDNCALASLHIVLTAHASGLGSCINGYFVSAAEYVPEIKEILKIPAADKIYGCVALGWPAHHFVKLPARKEAEVTFI